MRSIMIILSLGMSLQANAKQQDLLIHGCKMGVAVTQGYLNKDSDLEMTRMHLRCVGGIERRPKIREEFNKEKSLEGKQAYACGLGIGVALGFYNKQEVFNDKSKFELLANKCIKALNK